MYNTLEALRVAGTAFRSAKGCRGPVWVDSLTQHTVVPDVHPHCMSVCLSPPPTHPPTQPPPPSPGLLLLPAVPEAAGRLLAHLGVPQTQWTLQGLQGSDGPAAPFHRPPGTPIGSGPGGSGAVKLVLFPKPSKK